MCIYLFLHLFVHYNPTYYQIYASKKFKLTTLKLMANFISHHIINFAIKVQKYRNTLKTQDSCLYVGTMQSIFKT